MDAWLLYVIALWGWHHPAAYQSALRHELVYAINHRTGFGFGGTISWVVGRMMYPTMLLVLVTRCLREEDRLTLPAQSHHAAVENPS